MIWIGFQISSEPHSYLLVVHRLVMATRGVFQLTKLTLHYCEVGGSSRAMREYLGNGQLVSWASNHPHVSIEVKRRNGHHPFVHADYLTNSKVIHQVTVKNYESWNEVEEVLDMLANRSGRKITKIIKPVLTDTPSVQGVWTPFLNLQHEPDFEIEIVEGEPQRKMNVQEE
jgi:large subunit ribosomal protein L43